MTNLCRLVEAMLLVQLTSVHVHSDRSRQALVVNPDEKPCTVTSYAAEYCTRSQTRMWTSSFVTIRRRRKPPNYHLRVLVIWLIHRPWPDYWIWQSIALFWNKSKLPICRTNMSDECRCPTKTIILIYHISIDSYNTLHFEVIVAAIDRGLFVFCNRRNCKLMNNTEINLFLRIYPQIYLF